MSSEIYRKLKSKLDQCEKSVVITPINAVEIKGESSYQKILLTEEHLNCLDSGHCPDRITADMARLALETGNIRLFQDSSGVNVLIEPYFPRPHLIVLGGGDIAKPLVEFGSKVGFLVTVIDDRPIFANKDRFPDAERVICESFNNCFTQFSLNEYSFVVIVTREHRHDLDCLKQVLNFKTAYIGMIGSKRSVNLVKEQLVKEGYANELINKVNTPIGLKIGAVTTEEIAISIIAQIISYRRIVRTSKDDATSVMENWPELDKFVLEELCKYAGEPKALITIISTEGSVPRKAGTKMLVWSYGMTMGSIGGGYAEGEVINAAWQIIGTGGFKIHDIHMEGQIAEEEGMVCGGIMRVLIEDYTG